MVDSQIHGENAKKEPELEHGVLLLVPAYP
jgi:hypothetical protein